MSGFESQQVNLHRAVLAALVAGAVAGGVAGLFHLVFTEPTIDAAISLEAVMRHEPAEAMPVVSREAQRIGLVLGFLIYGAALGVLLGCVYALVQRAIPLKMVASKAAAFAGITYWSLALVPFFKYPANPPGVGDPDTIQFRQMVYLALMGLAVLVTLLTLACPVILKRVLPGQSKGPVTWFFAAVANVALVALLYVLMPANPDPMMMPESLVFQFRALSLSGVTLLWVTFALVFSVLLQRNAKHPALDGRSPLRPEQVTT